MTVVADLVTDVIDDGNFDVDSTRALRWLNGRHRAMVVKARSLNKTVEIGPSQVDVAEYPLPADVIQIRQVVLNGKPIGQITAEDRAAGQAGWLTLSGAGVALAPAEDASGGKEVAIYPAPDLAGLSILLRAACRPGELVLGDDSTLVVPTEFHDGLVAGAIATGLLRTEQRPDLAANHEGVYQAHSEEYRLQTARLYRGAGPAFIRIAGINA